MPKPRFIPTKLLWVDLEMTNLSPTEDVILEIAAEITNFDFTSLATYEARINHPEDLVRALMAKNAWWEEFPANRDNFINGLASGKPSEQVEQELIKLVEGHFGDEPALLAGNSIYCDRGFIKQWWPKFNRKLHYRMLDVSAFKVLMQGKYGVEYEKPEIHRAQSDIRASIAELQYYLEWFHRDRHDA